MHLWRNLYEQDALGTYTVLSVSNPADCVPGTGFVSAVKWLTGALIGSERFSPLQQIIGMLVGAAPFLPFPLHYKNMYCRETKYHMAPCAEPVTAPAPCSAQKLLLCLGSGGRKFWKGEMVAIAAESAHLLAVCRSWSPQPHSPTPVWGAVPRGSESGGEKPFYEGESPRQVSALRGALGTYRGAECEERKIKALRGKTKQTKKKLHFCFSEEPGAFWGRCLQRRAPFREAALMQREETCCVRAVRILRVFSLVWSKRLIHPAFILL